MQSRVKNLGVLMNTGTRMSENAIPFMGSVISSLS